MFNKEALQYLSENLVGFQHVNVDVEDIASPLVCVGNSSNLASLEKFQDRPNRITASVRLSSCDSFCAYVNRFKNKESTVYLDVDNGSFAAVLDHHGANSPSWLTHSASFAPKKSLEWQAWTSIHGKKLTQIELALFVEQQLDSIHEPEPNVMLKAALDFQANESLVLGSTANLDDGGVRFTFNKDNVTKNVVFPHRITLLLPVHENEAAHKLEGRVRFRVGGDGSLAFVFTFVKNPQVIERTALEALSDTILTNTKGLPHYQGSVR